MYAVAIAESLLVVLCSLTSWCQASACWAVHRLMASSIQNQEAQSLESFANG